MTITLSSSTPAQSSADFFLNKPIELVFNKAIATASLTNSVFGLIDIDTGTAVPATVTAGSNDATYVYILPSQHLKANTQYRIIIVGSDTSIGYTLTAQDSDTLTTTIVVEFSTGTTVYKIDTTVQKQAADLTMEGSLFLPTNVKALGYDFTVEKVRPKNYKHGVDPSLTGDNTIRFTFSKTLYTGSTDFEYWADVSLYPLLNDVGYLATDTTFGTGVIPGYTMSATGQDFVITFDGNVPKNMGIQVRLLDGITANAGDQYGGNMVYTINTKLYPEIYGVESVKMETKEIADVYNDVYIGALLFKNTIWLWEKVGRGFPISSPTFAAKQYIIYSTILDLMEDKEYSKYVVAGTRRQLGDLGVSVDNIVGKIAMKVAKYQKLKDVALESVISGWQFKIGTSTAGYDAIASQINRLWYDVSGRFTESIYTYAQDDLPAANVAVNRQAKTNNPVW